MRRVEWIAILIVLAIIVTITMWPTPVDAPFSGTLKSLFATLHRDGVPAWVNYDLLQTSSNVLMFVPLGALIASVVWAPFWWVSGVIGLALSLTIELTQYVLLPHRFATAGDLIANTAGALIGGAIVWAVRGKMKGSGASRKAGVRT